jgi:hypothetical protein
MERKAKNKKDIFYSKRDELVSLSFSSPNPINYLSNDKEL